MKCSWNIDKWIFLYAIVLGVLAILTMVINIIGGGHNLAMGQVSIMLLVGFFGSTILGRIEVLKETLIKEIREVNHLDENLP